MTDTINSSSGNTPSGPSRSRLPLIAGLGLAVIAIAAIAFFLLRGDAPEAATLDAATSELTDDGSSDEADDASTDGSEEEAEQEPADAGEDTQDAGPVVNVSGDWTVDTSIGEFSFEDSTGTFVGFRVGEELTTVGVTEAVGRTPAVSGTITIDGETVTAVDIEADMTAITTDISRRDNATRRALGTDEFPSATFVLSSPIELGTDPASGQPFSGTAVGDLTVHGVTNPVEVAIDAQLVGDTIAIVGSTDVVFADYGVTAPSAPVVVRLDDFGVIEFQLFLTKG